jgi:prolyl 4-hydroxylase
MNINLTGITTYTSQCHGMRRNGLPPFFAILGATCETCRTRFPDLKIDWSKEDQSCRQFLDCSDRDGITIRPIPGNALFWKNLDKSGAGDARTLHAGLPPIAGVKTGLNIWTHTPRIAE